MAKGNRGENIIKRPAADMGVVWGCKEGTKGVGQSHLLLLPTKIVFGLQVRSGVWQ